MEAMDEDLPGYFDVEDPPVRQPRTPPAPPAPVPPPPLPRPKGSLIPVGVATQPPTATTVVVQVVPTPPDVAARRLEAWARTASARPWRVGHDRLDVALPSDGHVRVVVRRRARPPLAIDVACGPWSTTRAEFHVVPARPVHDRSRYFRAAHAVLDRLVRELR